MGTLNNKTRPLMVSVELKEARLKNGLVGKISYKFKLERKIEIGLSDLKPAKDGDDYANFNVACFVEVRGVFFSSSSNEVLSEIESFAKYEVKFKFDKDTSYDEVKKLLNDESYQYVFVSQSHPVVVENFKLLMSQMGISMKQLPFGIV